MAKIHAQNLIEVLCHNLYRSPGIIASNRKFLA
jgi:IS5 family transposase